MVRVSFIFGSLLLGVLDLRAELKLHPLFSDHAVLQADVEVPVYGWADAGEEVTVSFAGQKVKAKTDDKGKWLAKLSALARGGPHVMTVAGKTSLTVNDMLVGEVWLGSGQSNMAMTVSNAQDFEKEKAAATQSTIRMFKVKGDTVSKTPLETCEGVWNVVSPETVGSMSATLFFFGRDLQVQVNCPVGLINSSTGGTPIESWVDKAAQEANPALTPFLEAMAKKTIDEPALKADFEKRLAEWTAKAKELRKAGQPVPQRPRNAADVQKRKADIGGRFNGKISPLLGYAIRGVLWYQGEANSHPEKAQYYEAHMTTLIHDWRKRWNAPEMPFGLVQLPNFGGRGEPWCLVREGVRQTVAKVPNVGMAVTIDIGDEKDIHPKNKQTVGRRLAAWAVNAVYNEPDMPCIGPFAQGFSLQGMELTVSFTCTNGLEIKNGGGGFELMDEQGNWQPATARAQGNSVALFGNKPLIPCGVRYAWKDMPDVSLWDVDGLPASPFVILKKQPAK
jgi:sialate O-acetylesterase